MIDGSGKATLAAFDGREYSFQMKVGQLRALEAIRKRGAYQILRDLQNGSWFVDDVIEILRIALRGGGMSAEAVSELSKHWIEGRPPVENLATAKIVLSLGLYGPPDDPVGDQKGKDPAEKNKTESPSPP